LTTTMLESMTWVFTSDAGALGTKLPSSEMVVMVLEASIWEECANRNGVIVKRCLLVKGNIQSPRICRVRKGIGIALGTGALTDEENAEEAASRLVTLSLGMLSIDVDPWTREDIGRPLVGEYWPRFAYALIVLQQQKKKTEQIVGKIELVILYSFGR
jgi:hypothetical protein